MGNPAFAGGVHFRHRQTWSVFPIADTAYTPDENDVGSLMLFQSASPTTLTIPPDASLRLPVGATLSAMQGGAGAVTIAAGAGVTLNRVDGYQAKTWKRWATVHLYKIAENVWVLGGELAAN